MSGIEAAQEIRIRCPETQVIILSMHGASSHVMTALSLGVQGFLMKASAGGRVVDAIRAVNAGKRYLDAEILEQVVETSLQQQSGQTDELKPLELLSAREHQVLLQLVEGKTNQEIALILKLSPKTIETYRCAQFFPGIRPARAWGSFKLQAKSHKRSPVRSAC